MVLMTGPDGLRPADRGFFQPDLLDFLASGIGGRGNTGREAKQGQSPGRRTGDGSSPGLGVPGVRGTRGAVSSGYVGG